LHVAARKDFKAFWSAHRWWATGINLMAALCVATVFQIMTQGSVNAANLGQAAVAGLVGLAVSLGGNYLISMRRGAEALDAARGVESSGLKEQINRLTPPKRTPSEEHHYREAKTALEDLGPDAIALLRHLKKHGTITFTAPPMGSSGHPITQTPLPKAMGQNDVYNGLQRCVSKSLVSPTHQAGSIDPGQPYPPTYICFRIAEGMKEVLDELLYPATAKE
jgi:hypothetical protein